jgi:transcriptional regulator with XRE-family HTH domain
MGDVADRTGLSKSTVHRIENDTLENRPSPESLVKLARALGTEVEDYFTLAGYVTAGGLPGLGPYLRTKYDASEEVATQVEDYLRFLQSKDASPDK